MESNQRLPVCWRDAPSADERFCRRIRPADDVFGTHRADTVGLANVLAKLKKYEHLGSRFQPTEQMRKLAAEGKGFYPDA
jgi:hypothetical protein